VENDESHPTLSAQVLSRGERAGFAVVAAEPQAVRRRGLKVIPKGHAGSRTLTLVAAVAFLGLGAGGENRVSGRCGAVAPPGVEVLSAETPDGWTSGPTPTPTDGPCLVLLPKDKTEATTDKVILVQYQDRLGPTNLVTNIKDYARFCAVRLMTAHPDLVRRTWDPAASNLKGYAIVGMELVDNTVDRTAYSRSHRLAIVEVRNGWYVVDLSVADPVDLLLPMFASFFHSLEVERHSAVRAPTPDCGAMRPNLQLAQDVRILLPSQLPKGAARSGPPPCGMYA
jgi:hypothetical protein